MNAIDFIEELPCYVALVNIQDFDTFLEELDNLLAPQHANHARAISVMARVNSAWVQHVEGGGAERHFDFVEAVRQVAAQ